MKKANNPQNLEGKGFDKYPEHINRDGRPPKLPDIDEIISKVLMETTTNKLTRAENIFRKMCIKAESDVRAAEMIFDRAYGKVKQRTEITVPPGTTPIMAINYIIPDGPDNSPDI